MKKIFWTSIFWFLIIFLFRSYVRLFNHSLSKDIASWFVPVSQVCVTGDVVSGVNQQLDLIKTELTTLTQQLTTQSQTNTPAPLFQTKTKTKVALYYFNQSEDQKLPPESQISIESLLPVYRIFPPSDNLLVDTIRELLRGRLTPKEQQQGFVTELPNADFVLQSATLVDDGILLLKFSEVPGFTDGGSARMLILSTLIKKTALQFPGVKSVIFVPETLFQP